MGEWPANAREESSGDRAEPSGDSHCLVAVVAEEFDVVTEEFEEVASPELFVGWEPK